MMTRVFSFVMVLLLLISAMRGQAVRTRGKHGLTPPDGTGATKLAELLSTALVTKNISQFSSYLANDFEAYVGGWADNFGQQYGNCPGKMNRSAYIEFVQHQMDTSGLVLIQPTIQFKSYLSVAMQVEYIFFNKEGTVAVTAPKLFYMLTVDSSETVVEKFMELAPFTNQANSAQIVSLWNTLANSVAAKSSSQLASTLSDDFVDLRWPQDSNTSCVPMNKSATVASEAEQMKATTYGQVVTTSVFPACDYVWQAWLEPLTSTDGRQTIIRGLSVLKYDSLTMKFSEWIEFGEYVE